MTRSERFVDLLVAATIGVYALVALGATTTITAAAEACTAWPTCGGAPLTPAVAVVWGHRLGSVVVGALVLAATVLAWRRGVRRRVRLALTAACLLYPVQVAIGAVAATAPAGAVSAVHLGVGVAIFSATVLSLAWTLEPEGGAAPDGAVDPEPAPAPPADAAAPAGAEEAPDDGRVPNDAPGASPTTPATTLSGLRARLAAYLRLTKPRLMWLLCLVAAAGMALAAGSGAGTSDPAGPTLHTVVATLGGGVLAIGASGTFNNAFERDRDRRMDRTADRPVATHQVPVRNAYVFGLALTLAAAWAFLQVNVLATVLGLAAIAYYSVVYTVVLKPNTVQNTVIGGFAGSLPALIGWAAVTNSIGVPALALAGVIFLWTPAHFYNLAMAYREDYAAGGFPMLPVVYGDDVARKHVVLYLGATLVAAAGLAAVSGLGPLFAATTVGFGALFLWLAVVHHYDTTRRAALRTFHASNAYLGAVLVAIVVDGFAL